MMLFCIYFYSAEMRALPKNPYLKKIKNRKFPEPEIPPRDGEAEAHADAILASAQGKFR